MRLRVLLLCAVLFSIQSSAQEQSRVELFGGYSRTNYSVFGLYSGPWISAPMNGWEASAAFPVHPHLAAEADFVGGYSPTNHYSLRTYMGGLRVSTNIARITLYAHGLLGGLTFNSGGLTNTATTFAIVLGGGADCWFSRHIGARPIQFDYLRNNNPAAVLGFEHAPDTSGPGNRFRIATGIMFRFGHTGASHQHEIPPVSV